MYETQPIQFDEQMRQEIRTILPEEISDDCFNTFVHHLEIAVQTFQSYKMADDNTVPPEHVKQITLLLKKLERNVKKNIQNIEQFESPENAKLYNKINPAVGIIGNIKDLYTEISRQIDFAKSFSNLNRSKKPNKTGPHIILTWKVAASITQVLNLTPTKYKDGLFYKLFRLCLQAGGEFVGDDNTDRDLMRLVKKGLSSYFAQQK